MSTIKLVQNDTGPDVYVTLNYKDTGLPIDVSNVADVVRLYFRKLGATALKTTIVASKPNGGADGYVKFVWAPGDLDTVGAYEAEVEITFNTAQIYTIDKKLSLVVREQIG
jgi:hypothetical protein